jgi:hypothetical protein
MHSTWLIVILPLWLPKDLVKSSSYLLSSIDEAFNQGVINGVRLRRIWIILHSHRSSQCLVPLLIRCSYTIICCHVLLSVSHLLIKRLLTCQCSARLLRVKRISFLSKDSSDFSFVLIHLDRLLLLTLRRQLRWNILFFLLKI